MTGDDKTVSPKAIAKAPTSCRSTATACPSVTGSHQLRLIVTKTLNGQFKGHSSYRHRSSGEFPKSAFHTLWLVGFAGIAWSAEVMVISRPTHYLCLRDFLRNIYTSLCACSLNANLIDMLSPTNFCWFLPWSSAVKVLSFSFWVIHSTLTVCRKH